MATPEIGVRKGWENRRNFEALPDIVWQRTEERKLRGTHAVLVAFLRRAWRPEHWDPTAAPGKDVEPLLLRQKTISDLLGIHRTTINRMLKTLSQVTGRCGNPIISLEGGKGRGNRTQVSLWSNYYKGKLLAKHAELRWGRFDPVHHGFWLPFGGITHGEVVRYFSHPSDLLTLPGGGIFLYLLHLARIAQLKDTLEEPPPLSEEQLTLPLWPNEATLEDPEDELGIMKVSRAQLETALGVDCSYRAPEFERLERLGWIRRNRKPRRYTLYDIAEAPAGLVELIALATASQRKKEFSFATHILDNVDAGQVGLDELLDMVAELGWHLTGEGMDLLRTEVQMVRLGPSATFIPRTPTEEAILQKMTLLELESHITSCIAKYGLNRVWTVAWNTWNKHVSLESPAGFFFAALEKNYDLAPPPELELDTTKYDPGEEYGDLFS